MFVFSVFRLLSRRCHKIFSIPQLLSCPSQNRTSGFPTSGSSVRHSVCLRPTTWVQVFADSRFRPLYPGQGLVKACPGVRPALALAVKPFEQNSCRAIDVVGAPFRVIRYGVIVQMPNYPAPSYSQHFAFAHYATRPYGPVRKLPQTGSQLLAAGATLQLEVSSPGLATIMGKTQKSELLRLGAALPGAFSGKTTKLDAAGLLLGHLQTKAFQPVLQSLTKSPRILLVLKTGQKIIGKTKIMRLAPGLRFYPTPEPQVQYVM